MREEVTGAAATIRGYVLLLHPDTIAGALILLVVFIAAGLVMSAILGRAIRLLLSRDRDERIDRMAASFLSQAAKVFLWLFVFMLYAHIVPALDRLGTALLASVSIASVVIGLAAQSTLANLVAGISLIFYRPFRLGDRLQVAVPGGTETGTVETVSLGYTILRTYDERRVVLSNSTISNAIMINLSSVSPRVMAMVPFSIGYGADIDLARAVAMEIAAAHPDVDEVVSCPVTLVGPSSVDLSLRVWCRDAATAAGTNNALIEAVKKRFIAEGIEIPFAYLNVVLTSRPSAPTSPAPAPAPDQP